MATRYDQAIAAHYAAFRPPLHALILDRLLESARTFRHGLDVGCGTGYSAAALARHCVRVTGLDPSPAMLALAPAHPKISYVTGTCASLAPSARAAFDVITFAGSLVYAKDTALRAALPQLCAAGARVLVYDFEVLLHGIAAELGVRPPAHHLPYDHALNLSDWPEFAVERQGRDRVRVEATPEQTAHLLLADAERYDALRTQYPEGDLLAAITRQLVSRVAGTPLEADLHLASYRWE